MIDHFDDRFVMDMDMRDRHGYVVFDASIEYNKSIREIWQRLDCNIVKETNMRFDALVALFVRIVKQEMTLKNVNKTRTWRKFLVK